MKTDSLGQLIMTGVPGKELDGKTAALFRKVKPGAFILFGRNIESAPQLRKLIDDLRDLSEIEPIITIDQVVRNAAEFNGALRGQGIASCGKHFPGYSAAGSDAHYELPRIDRTREQLDQNELAVFRDFIGRDVALHRPDVPTGRPYQVVDSMMICHGWYLCFEPEKTPATLSCRIVTDLLRSEFGFDGLVMTDDLDMGAILTGYRLEDTIRQSIAAGNDMAMICHRIPEIENVQRILATMPQVQVDRALRSVARLKERLTPPDEFSETAFRKIDDEIWDLRVAVLGEERAGQTTSQSVQRSPVEMF